MVWETKRSGGHGGQNAQKNETSVRVKHIPTGITVSCENERSQKQNKESALKVLRARIYAKNLEQSLDEENKARKAQVGLGQRGDKVRTYRFQDYRVIDHRTNKKIELSQILNGNLDLLKED